MHKISSNKLFYMFVKRGEEIGFLKDTISKSFSPAAQIYNSVVENPISNSNIRNFIIDRMVDLSFSSKLIGNIIVRKYGSLDKKSLSPIAENVYLHALNRGYVVMSFKYTGPKDTWLKSNVEDTELFNMFRDNLNNLIIEVVSSYANSSLRKN